jgi:hypothetical protein
MLDNNIAFAYNVPRLIYRKADHDATAPLVRSRLPARIFSKKGFP